MKFNEFPELLVDGLFIVPYISAACLSTPDTLSMRLTMPSITGIFPRCSLHGHTWGKRSICFQAIHFENKVDSS